MALTAVPAVGRRASGSALRRASMRLDTASRRDVLMVAGSTGLAPLKAMLEQLAARAGAARPVHLFFGSRTADGLYALPTWRRWRPGAGG